MEEELVSPKIDRKAYIKARLVEAVDDIDIAVNFWLSDKTRNAAGKAFAAVKALLSALVTKHLDELAKKDSWYAKKGYTVPTHSMNGIALDLADLGYKDLIFLVNVALHLHSYQYNGFDPDFSKYETKGEVLYDVNVVAEAVLSNLKKWFSEYWDERLETLYNVAYSDLERLKGGLTSSHS